MIDRTARSLERKEKRSAGCRAAWNLVRAHSVTALFSATRARRPCRKCSISRSSIAKASARSPRGSAGGRRGLVRSRLRFSLHAAGRQRSQRTPPRNDQRMRKALFGIDKLNVPRSDIPAVTHVDYSARIQTVHQGHKSSVSRVAPSLSRSSPGVRSWSIPVSMSAANRSSAQSETHFVASWAPTSKRL